MTCTACGEQSKNAADFTKAVIEINNPETLVLLRKVVIPATMGDEGAFPPVVGKYRNVLLHYEASGSNFLYSSDGIPTQLSAAVPKEVYDRIEDLEDGLAQEVLDRKDADLALSGDITALDNSLATVAKTGSYTDLTNKPTIGDGTLTIEKNSTSVGTFKANATSDTTIDISVPTKTSELTNDGSDNTSAYVELDDLATVATTGSYGDLLNKPTIDSSLSEASTNAIQNKVVSTALDNSVMTGLSVNANPSTTTVQLDGSNKNLYSGATTTANIPLPVASSTQAGVMNSATYDAVTSNTTNINAILNGAVAITGISASPSQSDLTTAWQTETGLTTLINRASIYDVTNEKVWTYYTNDTTWHAASNSSQVTINTFTNSSEGTIKGSTNTGQIFAENDGTGSVNGWDTLSSAVGTNTGNISSLQTAVAGKQNALTAGSNIDITSNVISATDTTYSAGTGMDLTGTTFSVDTTVVAMQTDIPTVNDSTLTIQNNGTDVATFTANSSTDVTANIVPPVQIGSVLSTPTNVAYVNANNIVDGAVTTAKIAQYAANNAILTAKNIQPASDTPGAWLEALGGPYGAGEGGYWVTYYNEASIFTNQPNQYGWLETISEGPRNIYQRWTLHGTGPVMYRLGNVTGWWNSSTNPGNFKSLDGDYTTTEEDTGRRWIDGRTIYRKTIDWGAMPNATRVNKTGQFPNNATIINIEAIAMSSTAAHNMQYVYDALVDSVFVGNTATGQLCISTTNDRSAWNAYITLYYCKAPS